MIRGAGDTGGLSGPGAVRPCADGRVNVGVLTPCLGCGGAEQTIRMMIQYCDPRRLRWVGVWLENPSSRDPKLEATIGAACPLLGGQAARDALLDTCDVVYCWGRPGTGAWFRGRKARRVLCSHGADIPFTGAALADAASAAALVAVSEASVIPYPSNERSRVEVIWNAAETNRIEPLEPRETIRKAWGVLPGMRVFGCQTRLSWEKELFRLVMALPYLPAHYRLALTGWGAEEDRLRQLAGDLGESDRLLLPGISQDVGGVLAALDVYAATSPSEGCSLALNEALVAGVPAVSTRTGLLKTRAELARLLPEKPSGQDVAAALIEDERDVFGTRTRAARAKAFALERLTEGAYGRRWTELFCRVAGG